HFRCYPECRKVARTDFFGTKPLGFHFTCQIERDGAIECRVLEDFLIFAECFVFRIRPHCQLDLTAPVVRPSQRDCHESPRFVEGQRPKQRRIDYGVDGRVDADSYRKRQNDDGCEAGLPHKRPPSVMQILTESLELHTPSLGTCALWFVRLLSVAYV